MMKFTPASSLRAWAAPVAPDQSADKEERSSRSACPTRGSFGPTSDENAASRVWVSANDFTLTGGAGGVYGANGRTALADLGGTFVNTLSRVIGVSHGWFVRPPSTASRSAGEGSKPLGLTTTTARVAPGVSVAVNDNPARNRCARSAGWPSPLSSCARRVSLATADTGPAGARVEAGSSENGAVTVSRSFWAPTAASSTTTRSTPRARSRPNASASTGCANAVRPSTCTPKKWSTATAPCTSSASAAAPNPERSSDGRSSATYGPLNAWVRAASRPRSTVAPVAAPGSLRPRLRVPQVSRVSGVGATVIGTVGCRASAATWRPSRPEGSSVAATEGSTDPSGRTPGWTSRGHTHATPSRAVSGWA